MNSVTSRSDDPRQSTCGWFGRLRVATVEGALCAVGGGEGAVEDCPGRPVVLHRDENSHERAYDQNGGGENGSVLWPPSWA